VTAGDIADQDCKTKPTNPEIKVMAIKVFPYITLQNGKLHDFYSSPHNIRQINSRRMRWAGYAARMREGRNVYRLFMRKPEGKRPLGRPRHRWEDGMKMDQRQTGCEGVEWIHLAPDGDYCRALVNAVMNLRDLASRSWLVS
jgi:hypothetical protein